MNLEAYQVIIKTKELDTKKVSLVPMYYNTYKRLVISEKGMFDRDVKYPELDLHQACEKEGLLLIETIEV